MREAVKVIYLGSFHISSDVRLLHSELLHGDEHLQGQLVKSGVVRCSLKPRHLLGLPYVDLLAGANPAEGAVHVHARARRAHRDARRDRLLPESNLE